MARPRKSEARDTRAEILSASMGLFADHGFHGTSMRDIAKAVGVRESALYHHFANKQELFEALLQQLGPETAAEIANGLDLPALVEEGPEAVLAELAKRVLAWWATEEQQQFARVIMAEAIRAKGIGIQPEEIIGKVAQMLGALFSELIRRRQLREEDLEVLALEFMGPMLVLRLRFLVVPAKPDLKRAQALARKHVAFFCAAAAAKAPRGRKS